MASSTLVHGSVDEAETTDFDVVVRFEAGRITQWQDRRLGGSCQPDGNEAARSMEPMAAGETT